VFYHGNSLTSKQANFNGYEYPGGKGPKLDRPCLVGSYQPNGFGLYDMHGNLEEYCADLHDQDYYARSPAKDPAGPVTGAVHVARGGHWFYPGFDCRSASRVGRVGGLPWLGFRVVLVPSG
jgi:formylglycine-generating enzyme required for sulfatase activity